MGDVESINRCFIVLPEKTVELVVGDKVFDDVEKKEEIIKEILRGGDGKIVVFLNGIERGRHLWELRLVEARSMS